MKNTKNISIVFLLSGAFLFSGCMAKNEKSAIEHQENTIHLQNIVEEVQKRSAYFSLERTEGNTVSLVLHNPKQEPIQSFSSEIVFPPHLVEVKHLNNTSEDIFGLFMPSDWKIDESTGSIKIASASLGSAQKLSTNTVSAITVAQFTFEKKQQENTFIFDINENISNIFLLENGSVQSIVDKKRMKDLIIK